MRTTDELCAALDATGMPWANQQWWPERPPALPYMLLCVEGFREGYADNRTSYACTRYRVELYEHGRDYEAEASVSQALDDAGFAWRRTAGAQIDQTDVTMACWTTSARD